MGEKQRYVEPFADITKEVGRKTAFNTKKDERPVYQVQSVAFRHLGGPVQRIGASRAVEEDLFAGETESGLVKQIYGFS